MKLKELMRFIDPYQDLQLFNAMTCECYTDVTYVGGGSKDNMEALDAHMEDLVHGISSGISNAGSSYLRITVDNVI